MYLEDVKNDENICKQFSEQEIDYCKKRKNFLESLAGKMAAKKAVNKLFENSIDLSSIEIINSKIGTPEVYLNGKKTEIKCSISHSNKKAVAVACKDNLVGVDIEEENKNVDDHFMRFVFSDREIRDNENLWIEKFCIKEAVIKILNNVKNMREIEIVQGKIYVFGEYDKSLTFNINHKKGYVIASVIKL